MTDGPTRRGGRRRALGVLAVAAAILGVVFLVVFFARQQSPPAPASSGSIEAPTTTPRDQRTRDAKPRTTKADDPLPASKPVSISIPAIGVESKVVSVGKNADGSPEIPAGDDIDKAAWYRNSPTPGQPGPSVIEGHIDTVEGPSVFYRLAGLAPGDMVEVVRADGSQVRFTVSGLRDYPTKEEFPTRVVYGGDLSEPSLRLITCSNFDETTGHYAGNTVVYAQLDPGPGPR